MVKYLKRTIGDWLRVRFQKQVVAPVERYRVRTLSEEAWEVQQQIAEQLSQQFQQRLEYARSENEKLRRRIHELEQQAGKGTTVGAQAVCEARQPGEGSRVPRNRARQSS